VDTAGYILEGDVSTKVKTPGTGKNNGRRGCANFYMERLCKLHYSQSRVHAWSPPGHGPLEELPVVML
jgi:hypothetical protein